MGHRGDDDSVVGEDCGSSSPESGSFSRPLEGRRVNAEAPTWLLTGPPPIEPRRGIWSPRPQGAVGVCLLEGSAYSGLSRSFSR